MSNDALNIFIYPKSTGTPFCAEDYVEIADAHATVSRGQCGNENLCHRVS